MTSGDRLAAQSATGGARLPVLRDQGRLDQRLRRARRLRLHPPGPDPRDLQRVRAGERHGARDRARHAAPHRPADPRAEPAGHDHRGHAAGGDPARAPPVAARRSRAASSPPRASPRSSRSTSRATTRSEADRVGIGYLAGAGFDANGHGRLLRDHEPPRGAGHHLHPGDAHRPPGDHRPHRRGARARGAVCRRARSTTR